MNQGITDELGGIRIRQKEVEQLLGVGVSLTTSPFPLFPLFSSGFLSLFAIRSSAQSVEDRLLERGEKVGNEENAQSDEEEDGEFHLPLFGPSMREGIPEPPPMMKVPPPLPRAPKTSGCCLTRRYSRYSGFSRMILPTSSIS